MSVDVMDETLAEVRRIKEECARERLARTPEEEALHMEEVIKRAEARLGRPIKAATLPKSAREATPIAIHA